MTKTRRIGSETVGAIGLGCMGMSFAYGPGNDDESMHVLERALELGCNHWDTADMYGAGKNELLLGRVLARKRDQVFLATKFANVYDRSMTSHQDLAEQNVPYFVDGTPQYVRKCIEASLLRLGVDHIDLYYQHRVDPRVPVEETFGAMAELVKEGKVRYLGISEAKPADIRKAHKVHPIAALQTEYSLWTRHVESDILPTCRELGITFVAYSPLGRGFLTGQIKSLDDLPEDDWRRMNPRFQEEALRENLRLVDRVKVVAERKGVAPAQIALAWVLSRGDDIAPIPGTKRVKWLEQNLAADSVTLTPEDVEEIGDFQAVGERYVAAAMPYVS